MKRLLLYLLAVATIVACSKSDDVGGGNSNNNETPKQPEITLDATASNFTTDGGQSEITFTSSAAWTAEVINTRADVWCTVNPTSGAAGDAKITVTTTANDTPDDRTASIIIKAGTASKTIAVSQKQKDALTVTASKFEVGAEGGEVAIEVKANIDFEYAIEESAKEWITYQSTRAMKTSTLVFKVAKNDDIEKREAKITIKSGEFHEFVTIYQTGAEPSIVISQNEYIVSSDSETIAVDVTSNVDVAVEIPSDVDWIAENTTRAMSTNTYYFDILPNDNYDQREAEIKFTNKANGLSESVRIMQSQKDAVVISKSTYNFGRDGGDLYFKAQTNADISVSISDDAQSWILTPTTRSMDIQSLYFEIAYCDGNDAREGVITLSAGDAVQKIRVVQNPLSTTGSQLLYKSSDGNIVTPTDPSKFGATIVSNEYKNGIGIITFDNNATAIGEHAFDGCTTLVSLDIPEGITSIGDYAFAGCSSMEHLSLSNTILSIGNYAFQNCTGEITIHCDIPDAEILDGSFIGTFEKSQFTKVVISDWVTKIGNKAFYECNTIKSITIPKSIIEFGTDSFNGCSGELTVNCNIRNAGETYEGVFYKAKFTKVNITEGVTNIGSRAFLNCSSITSLYIPSSLTNIGSYAFGYCNSITGKIVIPLGITKINHGTFYKCSGITSLHIPDGVTNIDDYAFYECNNLISIDIPQNMEKIGNYAFYGCRSIKSLYIPNSVKQIGRYAFYGCIGLKDLYISSGVEEIGTLAFANCSGELIVNCNMPNGYYDHGSDYGIFYSSNFTKVTISEGVTNIGNGTFNNCSSLMSITIPNSVTSIGGHAFSGCSSITSITIPSSVTEIGNYAFSGCGGELTVNCNVPDNAFTNAKFTKTTISEGVTNIGNGAFNYCRSLMSITIPNSVTNIGSYAFAGCTGEVIINCNTPDTDDCMFEDADFSIATFGENVTRIGDSLFYNNESLKTVIIGSNITSIGKDAFYDCSYLHSVYCKPTIPPALDSKDVFNYNAEDRKFYVPKGSAINYKAATNWSTYFDKIENYDYGSDNNTDSLEKPDDSGNDVEW